jgi:hypothetical protein
MMDYHALFLEYKDKQERRTPYSCGVEFLKVTSLLSTLEDACFLVVGVLLVTKPRGQYRPPEQSEIDAIQKESEMVRGLDFIDDDVYDEMRLAFRVKENLREAVGESYSHRPPCRSKNKVENRLCILNVEYRKESRSTTVPRAW